MSNLDRHPTSREGVTCVVCHRINKRYNKASGRLALVEGGLTAPIYGPKGNAEMEAVLENTKDFKVQTDPNKPGRKSIRKLDNSPVCPNRCSAAPAMT